MNRQDKIDRNFRLTNSYVIFLKYFENKRKTLISNFMPHETKLFKTLKVYNFDVFGDKPTALYIFIKKV